MDVVKLPKKVRMVCYEIMDGKEEALDTLESFANKYPHQVTAVKAKVAYFNPDYEQALALDLTILPWLEEWYYSNMSDEHMIAMEEMQDVPMADSSYRDAIAHYLCLGEREKSTQTAERLATSRPWAVAGPTQVRPMSFFEDANLRKFLLEPESLRHIREAAFIDSGTLTRK